MIRHLSRTAVHGFIKSAYYVMEKEKFNTHFQLNVKGETKFGSALVVSGTITAEASDTAGKVYFHLHMLRKCYNLQIRLILKK